MVPEFAKGKGVLLSEIIVEEMTLCRGARTALGWKHAQFKLRPQWFGV
jgi:hypothetical protein